MTMRLINSSLGRNLMLAVLTVGVFSWAACAPKLNFSPSTISTSTSTTNLANRVGQVGKSDHYILTNISSSNTQSASSTSYILQANVGPGQ